LEEDVEEEAEGEEVDVEEDEVQVEDAGRKNRPSSSELNQHPEDRTVDSDSRNRVTIKVT
jgi:hypothetical protein